MAVAYCYLVNITLNHERLHFFTYGKFYFNFSVPCDLVPYLFYLYIFMLRDIFT